VSVEVTIGTRGSELALWQAEFVKAKLQEAGHQVNIKIIKTKGDQIQHLGFDKMEGKGFFTKELEDSLLSKEVDLAVHSCKDLETNQPEGLTLAAYAEEADPRDVLIIKKESAFKVKGWPVKHGALVGTSSARRKVQLLAHRPDLDICDLRGNVPTRLQKLRDGNMDAIVLAAAGVTRLKIDLSEFETYFFPADEFVPAAAQGVLALQTRSGDHALIVALQEIWPQQQQQRVQTERRILNKFDGGCQVPLGVRMEENRLFVSYAPAREQLPRRISVMHESEIEDGIIDFLKNYRGGHRVFVSRDVSDTILEVQLKALGVDYTAMPLIETTPKPKPARLTESEWVFFTSANGVKSTRSWFTSGQKFAALGKATAAAGEEVGLKFDFIGTASETTDVARDFAFQCKPKSVLIPQSQMATKRVLDVLRLQGIDVFEIEAYQTNLKPLSLPDFDVYLFTSPSNVRSFALQNKVAAGTIGIAIGSTTLAAMQGMGFSEMICQRHTDIFASADALGEALYMLQKA
jgi:hydroxymethylbilane synthase